MTTYFGYGGTNNSDGSGGLIAPTGVTGQGPDNLCMMVSHNQTFVCPGVGNFRVTALSSQAYSNGGTPSNIDIAIYNAARTAAICYGSTPNVTTKNTAGEWYSATSIGGTAILVGGQTYVLAQCPQSADVMTNAGSGSSGDWWADVEDFPDSPHFWTADLTDAKWTWYTTETSKWCVIVSLEPDVPPSAAITGTVMGSITEADIV